MEEDTIRNLERDLSIIERVLRKIKNTPDFNFIVTDENYLEPGIRASPLPLNHPEGLRKYYHEIRSVLKNALLFGSLSKDDLPEGAPNYLRSLVSA